MKSVVEVYSELASKNPPWTANEEADFIRSCSTEDGKWINSAAKDRFVNEALKHNLNLVFNLVNKHSIKKNNEDIIQKAVIALAESLKKFDPASGNKISTWIQRPILWVIKHTQHTYYKGNDFPEQIAALNRRYNLKMSVVSVDAATGNQDGENDTYGNLISTDNISPDYIIDRGIKTTDDEVRDREIHSGVNEMLSGISSLLNKKEEYVIRGLLKGKNMSEISVELKLSRMRISQISANAFEKIRNSEIGKRIKGLL